MYGILIMIGTSNMQTQTEMPAYRKKGVQDVVLSEQWKLNLIDNLFMHMVL